MKKIFTLTLLVISAVVAFAQSNFYIYKTDGSVVEYVISEVDSIGFTKPAPKKVTKVLTFEDADAKFSSYELDYCGVTVNTWSDLIPAADEQNYGYSSLIYSMGGEAPYTWTDENNTLLTHTFPYNFGTYSLAGGGIVISNHFTTLDDMMADYDIYNHQLSIINESAHNGSNHYAIAYNDSKVDPDAKISLSFTDGEAHKIKGMYVTIPAVSVYCMLYGNSFSDAFAEDDFLKLVATGTKADGSTSTVEIMLAVGDNYDTWALDWTYFDLSSLGEVTEVTFNMVEAQIDDYGYGAYYRTPMYFAFDDVEVEF